MKGKLSGKSIRSINRVKDLSQGAKSVLFVKRLDEISPETLRNLGFSEEPVVGDHLVPAPIGKVTFYNANGGERKRTDLPKVKRTIDGYRTWKDWHGQEHSGHQSRTIDAYPVETIPAPETELSILEIDNIGYVASPEVDLEATESLDPVHVANLMLECFQEVQLANAATEELVAPKLRQLHWQVLPPGKYPWDRARSAMRSSLARLAPKSREAIEYRMKVLSGLNPDFLAVGSGGFGGYYVYGYTDRNLYVLESVYLDNATYVFADEWEAFSKLTKAEILNEEMHHDRIIHNGRWVGLVRRLLRR